MYLDVAGPVVVDGNGDTDILFLIVGIVLMLCIIGIIVFYKVRNKRRKK